MNSGMVRRIDELGRIVIPKEIRKSLKLNMGDSVEIYVEDNKISLKKHSSLLGLEEELFNIAKVINESTNSTILFADINDILVSYGKLSENYLDKPLNTQLFHKINNNSMEQFKDIYITPSYLENRNSYLFSLTSKSNILGLMIIIENDKSISNNDLDNINQFKKFICKQLEK